jgi:CheY-like chemotaxis protein
VRSIEPGIPSQVPLLGARHDLHDRGASPSEEGVNTCAIRGGCDRMPIRVHLADDHTMFREGLAAILTSRAEDIEVVGQTSTGEEAIALIEENKPDFVIMQVEMQLKEVREIFTQIRAVSPNSGIMKKGCSPKSAKSKKVSHGDGKMWRSASSRSSPPSLPRSPRLLAIRNPRKCNRRHKATPFGVS